MFRHSFGFCSLSLSTPWVRHSLSPPAFHASIVANFRTIRAKGAKTGQKQTFIWLVLSHPRKIGDNKRQKPNIFLKCGCKVGAGCGSACLPFCVSTGGRWSGSLCYFVDVSKIGQNTAGCSAFCPFATFACGGLLAYMPLFRNLRRFSARFGVVVWVCVILVVCVACVALYAWIVRRIKGLLRVCLYFISFALLFVLLSLLSSRCRSLPWLYLFVLLLCLCGSLLFSFPFRTICTKRKGASPCVLPCPVVGCISLVPCALLLVFGFPRLGMPLYLPSFPSFALCRSCYKTLHRPNRIRYYFAELCNMYICLLLFSYLSLLIGFPCRFYSVALLYCFSVIIPDLYA